MTTAVLTDPESLVPRNVPGWTDDIPPLYAAVVAEAADGARFVEVGCWMGRSAILMARLIKASGKKIRFTCVDTFKGSPGDPQYFAPMVADAGGSVRHVFDAHLRQYGVYDMVGIIEGPSVKAAAAAADGSLDFVFLDADHTYESVVADIRAWLPKVKPDGLLAGHDWGYMGVAAAVLDVLGQADVAGACWLYQKPEG